MHEAFQEFPFAQIPYFAWVFLRAALSILEDKRAKQRIDSQFAHLALIRNFGFPQRNRPIPVKPRPSLVSFPNICAQRFEPKKVY